MISWVLRRQLFLKRHLISALGYNPKNATSLFQKEEPSKVKSEFVERYADSSFTEMLDPRNYKQRGHYFEARGVFIVKDVVLEPRQGIIYTQGGYLIEESTSWSVLSQYNSFPWNFKKLSKKTNLKNAIYVTSNSYGHWLIEDLALTIATMSKFPDSPIICHKNPPKYVIDFLHTANREVTYVDGPVQVDSLIMITKGNDSGWVHPQDFLELTNYEPFKIAMKSPSRVEKVYASRIGLRRSPINEFQVEKIFKELDFVSIHLEDLGLIQEISLISGLKYLAGIHGSTFVNQIWMSSGPKVLEIVNKNYWTEMDHSKLSEKHIKKSFFSYEGPLNGEVPLGELNTFLKEF